MPRPVEACGAMLTHNSAVETPASSPEEARTLQEHRLHVYVNSAEDHLVYRLWGRPDDSTRGFTNRESNLHNFINSINDKLHPSST